MGSIVHNGPVHSIDAEMCMTAFYVCECVCMCV